MQFRETPRSVDDSKRNRANPTEPFEIIDMLALAEQQELERLLDYRINEGGRR